MKAIVIDPSDNVVVVLGPVAKGDEVTWKIKKGDPIIKYGQYIGIAGCDIKRGNYVHVHNVISHREENLN